MNKKKLISIVIILILVLNLILFALQRINELVFWLVIAIGFAVSYFLNKNKNKQIFLKKNAKTKNN